MKPGAFILAALSVLLLSGCRFTSDLRVVENFEIDRYLGTWYEAARYPHRFEEGLTAVTAEYTLNPNGTIKVVNSGYDPGKKKWEQAIGEARFKGDSKQGWLKVSFFKPFYAAYKILYLNDEYTEAIVTGPTYNYLWILVRDREIPKKELDRLFLHAHEFGFDTNKLITVDQSITRR